MLLIVWMAGLLVESCRTLCLRGREGCCNLVVEEGMGEREMVVLVVVGWEGEGMAMVEEEMGMEMEMVEEMGMGMEMVEEGGMEMVEEEMGMEMEMVEEMGMGMEMVEEGGMEMETVEEEGGESRNSSITIVHQSLGPNTSFVAIVTPILLPVVVSTRSTTMVNA
jgi:hypothetical protein